MPTSRQRFLSLIGMIALVFSTPGTAETYHSGTKQVALIELYTSEGCSSCPPADKVLSKLKHHQQLFSTFVPVAFHVDYWDYLGWSDPFSTPLFTHRQRQLLQQTIGRSGYTPNFMISGHEWRGFFDRQSIHAPIKMIHQRIVGDLTVDIMPLEGNLSIIKASYQPAQNTLPDDNAELMLSIAPLAMEQTSVVQHGENRNRTLHHDFIALDWLSAPMQQEDGRWQTTMNLDTSQSVFETEAFAAWVSIGRQLKPIQSVGGYWPQ